MFCRNCGNELEGAPESCMTCGARPMAGTSFCPECGAPTTPLAETCTGCGAQVATATKRRMWKAKAAGILAVISGVLAVSQWVGFAVIEILADNLAALGGIVAAGFIIAIGGGIVAIVGGVFALKRRRWRLALAGSICAIFSVVFLPILVNVPLAIAAIVLVVLGRGEFE